MKKITFFTSEQEKSRINKSLYGTVVGRTSRNYSYVGNLILATVEFNKRKLKLHHIYQRFPLCPKHKKNIMKYSMKNGTLFDF